jgi:hypothetical protein
LKAEFESLNSAAALSAQICVCRALERNVSTVVDLLWLAGVRPLPSYGKAVVFLCVRLADLKVFDLCDGQGTPTFKRSNNPILKGGISSNSVNAPKGGVLTDVKFHSL